MNNFEYVRATAIPDALGAIARQAGSRFLAGGTTMVDLMKCGVEVPSALIDITRVRGLVTIEAGPASVRIGALSKMSDVADHPTIRKDFPVLAESLWRGASAQLRNMATIGGNLCNASPSADSAPALMVAGATVTFLDDGGGEQTVPVAQFFAGPGRSILGPSGLLLRIDVPGPAGMTGSSFERLTPRSAMDIAIVSAASQITLEPSSGRVHDVAIALGAVAPTPVRAPRAEETLRSHEPSPELLAKAAAAAMDECSPIGDIRGGASYRKAMVEVLVRRTLERALERAQRQAVAA